MKSFYFIQSVSTIYLCMSMAIYLSYLLSYLLLEVVMLIRMTILNIFNRIEVFNHLRRDRKTCWFLKRVELNRDRLGIQVRGEVRWCEVYRLTSVYYVVIWKHGNRMIRMRMK